MAVVMSSLTDKINSQLVDYLPKVMVKFNTSHIFQHNIKFYLLISYQFIDSYKTVTL